MFTATHTTTTTAVKRNGETVATATTQANGAVTFAPSQDDYNLALAFAYGDDRRNR